MRFKLFPVAFSLQNRLFQPPGDPAWKEGVGEVGCAGGKAPGHPAKVRGNQLLREIGADLSRKHIWPRW